MKGNIMKQLTNDKVEKNASPQINAAKLDNDGQGSAQDLLNP